MPKIRILPYILIVTAGVTWGSTFSLLLIATSDGTHPLALITWEVLFSVIILAALCLVTKVTVFNVRHLRHYTVLAVTGISVPSLLYFSAAPHLSAGILSITVSTAPLFTCAIMWMLRFEAPIAKRAFGILLGMVAILLLILPDQGLSGDDATFWVLLVVLSAVFYAVESVYISEAISDRIEIRELLCGSNIVAAMILIPLAVWMGIWTPASWLMTQEGWAICAMTVLSLSAYAMFFHTIKTSGPVFASQCAYIVTISGVLWGILIFSESHSLWVWLSILVMLAGLALVTPSKQTDNALSEQQVSEPQ